MTSAYCTLTCNNENDFLGGRGGEAKVAWELCQVQSKSCLPHKAILQRLERAAVKMQDKNIWILDEIIFDGNFLTSKMLDEFAFHVWISRNNIWNIKVTVR